MNGNPVFIASKGNNDKRKSERKMLNVKNLAFAHISSIEFNKQAKSLVMDKYICKASKASEVSVTMTCSVMKTRLRLQSENSVVNGCNILTGLKRRKVVHFVLYVLKQF
ncbi:uncharacterized protein LOC118733702 [Rhagoletis pomonella]|uniref:uncharacterized protein LOC118733702 n=1 Tax=Rhagoletis pomonella TaxID=28610 RepID=UPI0017805796|nr:uncharacterized protein LOC118733702 [Rhagoletis pomonella]